MEDRFRNIIVVKQPRSDPIPDRPINFPPLENLHLELLENKRKIRPGLPPVVIQKRPPPRPPTKETFKKDAKEESKKSSESKSSLNSEPKSSEKKASEPKSQNSKPSEKKTSASESRKKPRKKDKDLLQEIGEDEIDPIELEFGEDEENSEIEEVAPSEEGAEDLEEAEEIDEAEEAEEHDEAGDHEDHDETEEPQETSPPEEEDIYAGLTPEEREAKEKEEFIWRFRILRKQYKSPKVEIPTFNEHSDLPEMKRAYDRTLRELYLDDAVDSYRTYLMGGFMVMEFVCCQWVGIDLDGFTVQQSRAMYRYDRMLVELGEKSYTRWGMNLPVEVRLIGFILLQAGMFYLGKIISDKYGGTVSELFKGLSGQPPDPEKKSDTPKSPPQKKMKGPRINPDDIRKMSSRKESRDEDEDE